MTLKIQFEKSSIFEHPVSNLRIWEDSSLAPWMQETWWLVARRGHRVVGTWLIPITQTLAGTLARRTVRLLPYSAPWLAEDLPHKRRHVWYSLIQTLQSYTQGIELPLAPGFYDYGAVCACGGFLEARHTYCVMNTEEFMSGMSPEARNHLKVAQRQSIIRIKTESSKFNFDAAIIDQSTDEIAMRRDFALALSIRGQVLVFEARRASKSNQILGEVLVILQAGYALIMHSWFDRHSGIRGIPTLLIVEAVKTCLKKHNVSIVDFEGSILASVEQFMNALGAVSTPYAIAYWYPDKERLVDRLLNSLTIVGRTV